MRSLKSRFSFFYFSARKFTHVGEMQKTKEVAANTWHRVSGERAHSSTVNLQTNHYFINNWFLQTTLQGRQRLLPEQWSVLRCSVQSLDRLGRLGTQETIQQRSFSSLFCSLSLSWAVLSWKGTSTLWHCPSSISSADHSDAHPPRCLEGWFWRGCRGV